MPDAPAYSGVEEGEVGGEEGKVDLLGVEEGDTASNGQEVGESGLICFLGPCEKEATEDDEGEGGDVRVQEADLMGTLHS